MGMLSKLIKTSISAVLLNKAVRSAFIVALIKSAKWTLRPSTRSRIRASLTSLVNSVPGSNGSNFLAIIFRGAAELVLLRFAKRGGLLGTAALSTLAALLLAMM